MKILSCLLLCFVISAGKADVIQDVLQSLFMIILQSPFPFWPATNVEEEDVSFHFVDRNNTKPVLVQDDNLDKIKPNKYTVYVVHGYISNSTAKWMTDMAAEYIKAKDMQVILVDWGNLAFKFYPESAQNTRGVGKIMAKNIVKFGVPISNIHLVGHSLGAHTCSFAANEVLRLTGQKVPRISGLDPAGPAFFGTKLTERLDATDANVVDVTHSDGGVFGYLGSLGTHDFFPNGGIPLQPSCPTFAIANPSDILDVGISTISCSHSMSIKYFTYSINNPVFKYTECWDYLAYLAGACYWNDKIVFGENMPLSSPFGGYYNFRLTWPV